MEQEIWKDIEGFEGLYQVSNYGNVKSLSRQVSKYEYRPSKMLKPKLVRRIYKVGLSNKTNTIGRRDYRIDILVGKTFVEGFAEDKVICHKDNDLSNNRADNLKWIMSEDYTDYTDEDNLPLEEWRDIKGYEGLYQVSNMGRVRSMSRRINNTLLKGELLSLNVKTGYQKVSLSGKHFFVHRLVAFAFCEGYAPGLVVNHKDENKTNNKADNLEWVTSEYNSLYGTAIARAKKKIHVQVEEKRKQREEIKKEQRIKKFKYHQQDILVDKTEEIWKDIIGFEGMYQISSWGRVKSMPKQHPCVQGGFYMTKERILIPRKHSNGYLNVQLCKSGKRRNYYIHRLVATAFLRNDNPKEYTDVNHMNEDKTDNHVTNLEWCSNIYNAVYGTKNERMLKNRPSMEGMLTKKKLLGLAGAEKPVLCIDNDGCIVAEYKSIMAASRATGYSAAKICQCCKGKRNKTGGYHWQYINKD